MARKKYTDFPAGTYDTSKFFLQSDPVTGALEKINLPAIGSSSYQPLNGDLLAIAALTGTAGILTKTAVDAWTLDTNSYVNIAGSYYNPAWLTAIDFSKIINTPTTIAGYGITDTYTKVRIDGFIQGITWKNSVRVATTANITLSGTQIIDGVAFPTTDGSIPTALHIS